MDISVLEIANDRSTDIGVSENVTGCWLGELVGWWRLPGTGRGLLGSIGWLALDGWR